MKKTLLYLFFLTTFSFYGQVTNMTHCAGHTTFNLTYQNSLLIGNLNPVETTVSYHLTAADATNGVNAISNPTNFIVPQNQVNLLVSQTIYARINHLGIVTTNYFSLIVNPDFLLAARIEPINCYSNGTIVLDVFNGQAPFECTINGVASANNFFYGPVSTLRIPNLVAGSYYIQIRDAIGCLTAGEWTIEPSSIIPLDTPTATVTNATCKGSSNGKIIINATGGTTPYTYSKDGITFVQSSAFDDLVAGNYTIYVKDALNCTSAVTTTISEPDLLTTTAVITKTIDCISNAVVTVAATGGTAPYTYSKDGITFVQNNVFDNLAAGNYTIYVKDTNGCISQNSINISPLTPLNTIILTTNVLCKGNSDGSITVNVTGGEAPYTYSIDNGVTFGSSTTFTGLSSGIYNVTTKDALNCLTTTTTSIIQPEELLSTISVIDQTANVTTTGGNDNYTYFLDESTVSQQSTIFSNVTPGPHTIRTMDNNGCVFVSPFFNIDTPAPLINGSNTIIQNFTEGQTLGDLVIPGENIKWYSNATPTTGKFKKASEVTLPLSTVIVDGTTYYASQTINGIESKERLAVTAKRNTLGTTDLILKNFTYYPNPVKDFLTLSNSSLIKEVSLISIKGELLLVKQINSLQTEIDLSNYPKGVYSLKVKTEDIIKTIKLIKD